MVGDGGGAEQAEQGREAVQEGEGWGARRRPGAHEWLMKRAMLPLREASTISFWLSAMKYMWSKRLSCCLRSSHD